MIRRPFLALLASLVLAVPASRARAEVLLEARLGAAGPVQGDIPSALGLDVGPAFGVAAGFEVLENVDLDFRFDGVWLFGSVDAAASLPIGGLIRAKADSSSSTYAITFGPTLHTSASDVELYLGVHPGLYLASWSLDGSIESHGGPIGVEIQGHAESDTSVDFGFNVEVGARYPVSDSVRLGAELAYHFDLIRDQGEDEAGALVGSLTVGWRR